ncbi:RNA-directed DNA polymerase [Gossypium australe]|uniref:RNA-directed DNA polymerase n=1 Tax=Gossypium australe TaxID=47621 RepID=A0A5B6VXC7_9ROSI|nr:RNA-directed DNA polymerase [Gossypium australe]
MEIGILSTSIARRKLNRVDGLIVGDGGWCFDYEILQQHVNFFQELYTVGTRVTGNFPCRGIFLTISEYDQKLLLMNLLMRKFIELFLRVLGGQRLDPNINPTLFVLIPKVPGPSNISQFHQISLCTVLYKIVTKTIVNKLRLIMADIASSIVGRNISDNIIVAQEVVHTMKTTKEKNY